MTGRRPARISDGLPARRGASAIEPGAFAQRVLESIPSGVVAVDREGRIVLVNAAAAAMLGLGERARLVGRPCAEALAGCPDVARLLLQTFDTKTPPNRAELELRHQRDRGRTIGYTLSLVAGAGGQVVGAAMFFKDLTWIERLEEQERLRDRLAVLGQMAAGLAHEMRNPLAAIEIHAGLLRRSLDPSLACHADSIEHILAESRRLNETVATCLDFVRPAEVVERPVPVEPLLDSAAADPAPGATRIVRAYAAGGTVALGDGAQLRQAFGNLIRNAREAAGASGTVWLRTFLDPAAGAPRSPGPDGGVEAEEAQVVVEVSDDGPGIPPEHRDRVFHPFFTTKPKGSGLGLAMVQKIIQSHRGRVDFASRAGGGTTFQVVLRPAAADAGR